MAQGLDTALTRPPARVIGDGRQLRGVRERTPIETRSNSAAWDAEWPTNSRHVLETEWNEIVYYKIGEDLPFEINDDHSSGGLQFGEPCLWSKRRWCKNGCGRPFEGPVTRQRCSWAMGLVQM
jgi:hypothetical protein